MLACQTVLSEASADRDLASRVSAFLASRHVNSLRRVNVFAHNGVVTLRGHVRSFYEKQLSQQCGRRVAGVLEIVDEIHVLAPESTAPVVNDPRLNPRIS